ncbi:MarR family winged helix-turn-helix transcriptional regulator [Heyndrickxia sporothermodurans]
MDNELNELELLFRKVYRKLKDQFNQIMNEYVTTNEYMVMKLMLNGKMRVTDLSKALQVSASHITSITDSLVQKKLVERERSSKDRRVVDLSLTTEGIDLIKQLNVINSKFIQDKFKIFSTKEKTDLIYLLNKLEEQLSTKKNDPI